MTGSFLIAIDGGRWNRTQLTAGRLAGCDIIAVALAPTLDGIAHSRATINALWDALRVPVVGVRIGDPGYGLAEIASQLDVPVAGSISWDQRGSRVDHWRSFQVVAPVERDPVFLDT